MQSFLLSQFLGRVPEEEKGVWGSQGGDGVWNSQEGGKDKRLSFFLYIP